MNEIPSYVQGNEIELVYVLQDVDDNQATPTITEYTLRLLRVGDTAPVVMTSATTSNTFYLVGADLIVRLNRGTSPLAPGNYIAQLQSDSTYPDRKQVHFTVTARAATA